MFSAAVGPFFVLKLVSESGPQAVESARERKDPERGRQRHDPAGQRVARRLEGARRLRVQECRRQGAHRATRLAGARYVTGANISAFVLLHSSIRTWFGYSKLVAGMRKKPLFIQPHKN